MKITLPNLLASGLAVVAVAAIVLSAFPTLGFNGSKGTTIANFGRETQIHETSMRTVKQASSGKELVSVDQFLSMLRSGDKGLLETLNQVEKNWDLSYVPMMLEAGRFLPPGPRAVVFRQLETKTGQEFGADLDGWLQWTWKQKFEPHPEYPRFKAALYSKIDPRFAEYFVKTNGTTVRLDEVRWGGVRRDGIPPLKNPKMLTADKADYLSDTDVVFGIDLNGDARCYPKRILAWHEMFKDTIGGESVCGVY